MKKRNLLAAGFLAFSVVTAGFCFPYGADAAAAGETYKEGAVVPADKASAVRNAAREKAMASYYITDGEKFDKAVSLLKGLDPEVTGLEPGVRYSFRMDKTLTGDYFYHVKAFRPGSFNTAGDYLLAKDDSCAYRRFPGENRTELMAGTTDKLLEKTEIYALYRKIPMETPIRVFVRVPGNIPYTLSVTSLNENMISVSEDESGQPVIFGIGRGKADVLAEVTIGGFSKSKKVNYIIMDDKDLEREENRSSGGGFPIGIGIGIGIGRGHHHGHRGGVVIGI